VLYYIFDPLTYSVVRRYTIVIGRLPLPHFAFITVFLLCLRGSTYMAEGFGLTARFEFIISNLTETDRGV
jgi:hypothetical protein